MDDKTIIESVKYRYLNDITNEATSLEVKIVSKEILDEVLLICDSTKHMQELIEWYDDEENPNWNNWVDVEGEGYGWLWLKEEDDETKWHGLLRERLLDYIETKLLILKESDSEEYVIVINMKDTTVYHFIQRESSSYDRIYTFSNNEIDF